MKTKLKTDQTKERTQSAKTQLCDYVFAHQGKDVFARDNLRPMLLSEWVEFGKTAPEDLIQRYKDESFDAALRTDLANRWKQGRDVLSARQKEIQIKTQRDFEEVSEEPWPSSVMKLNTPILSPVMSDLVEEAGDAISEIERLRDSMLKNLGDISLNDAKQKIELLTRNWESCGKGITELKKVVKFCESHGMRGDQLFTNWMRDYISRLRSKK